MKDDGETSSNEGLGRDRRYCRTQIEGQRDRQIEKERG